MNSGQSRKGKVLQLRSNRVFWDTYNEDLSCDPLVNGQSLFRSCWTWEKGTWAQNKLHVTDNTLSSSLSFTP